MKCIMCGKNDAVYENLCERCFLDNTKFVKLEESIDLTVCPHCSAIKIKKGWIYNKSLEKVLESTLITNATVLHPFDRFRIDLTLSKNQDFIYTEAEIKYKDLMKKENFITSLQILKNSCPRCNRLMGEYFESILQIRSDRELLGSEKNEILDMVYNTVKNENNPDIFIMKHAEQHGGLDFYISSNRFSKILARKLQEKYGGIVKESPHLYGRKDGADLYRVTYSVRLSDYRVGDFVSSKTRIFRILGISSKSLRVQDLFTGTKSSISAKVYKDEQFKVFAKKEDIKPAILIYSKDNEIEIMDVETNEIYDVKKPGFEIKERISILKEGNNVYLVPE